MEPSLFWKGMLFGFTIAAPVGPIGLLCIRRSVAMGPRHGLITGLGAATADAFYGSLAAFGITFLTTALVAQQSWIRLFGGAFLGYLGLKIFLSKSDARESRQSPATLLSSYTSSLFLTITNPMTILSFAAAFAGLGLQVGGTNYAAASSIVAGVFAGSAAWWLILSSITGRFHQKISDRSMTWINRLSGVIICSFAAIALYSVYCSFS